MDHTEASSIMASSACEDLADDDADILDPTNSERRIYREPLTGFQREIWRPGDGDGDQVTDYYERVGPPLPLKQRWRLFQNDMVGLLDVKNQPPRFVMLDDKAALDVLRSDIPKAKKVQNWPHDFGGQGKIRVRRPHRGRAAIKNANAEEDNKKYHSTATGNKRENYLFTGEKNYVPVVYCQGKPEEENPRKREASPDEEEGYNPRAHGHNQFTPKDLLVKHGAPSFSGKPQHTRLPRINTFLRRDPSLTRVRDRTIYGGFDENARMRDLAKHEDAYVASRGQEKWQGRADLYCGEEQEMEQDRNLADQDWFFGPNMDAAVSRNFEEYLAANDLPGVTDPRIYMGPSERRTFDDNLVAKSFMAQAKLSEQAEEIERLNGVIDRIAKENTWKSVAQASNARVIELEEEVELQKNYLIDREKLFKELKKEFELQKKCLINREETVKELKQRFGH